MGRAGLENKGGRLRAGWSPAMLRRRRLSNRTTDPHGDAAALDLGARRLGHAEDLQNLSPALMRTACSAARTPATGRSHPWRGEPGLVPPCPRRGVPRAPRAAATQSSHVRRAGDCELPCSRSPRRTGRHVTRCGCESRRHATGCSFALPRAARADTAPLGDPAMSNRGTFGRGGGRGGR